jgi:alcohol dehydrogenase (cytochrome c)
MKSRLGVIGAVIVILLGAFSKPGAQGTSFKPVTDAMLLNPDPADWPNWRRTLDGWGYSPLKQITTQNVNQLQLAWSWGLTPGVSQPTPLVSNGMMFVPSPGGGVQTLDAANGDLIWEYRARAADGAPRTSPMRNLAVYGDKVYIATADARLMALNARTGVVAWDHQVADVKLGYTYSSGPIVVKGMIVAGITGCQKYKNDVCFISAHDAQTGKEIWRASTVARPGEPGGDTWGDLPLMFRAGSDAWMPGSYDPTANLIYWGTAQAKPWTRFARGTDGDALYTNCTLAIDPATGKIVWYYQHIPGETHDLDEAFERILVDLGGGRSSVFTMGKLGILWELDRKTGAFVRARDLRYQNVLDVDPRTGKATYRANMIPKPGVELEFCPSSSGFKSLRAMAYHPDTQAFYIPLNLSCEKGSFSNVERVEGGGGSGGGRRKNLMHPESPDGIGELLAMSARTGDILWRHRTRTPPSTATLTTGGGLVVVGDFDRYLYVHDAADGRILFQTRLPTSVQGFPITYAVNGRQYLAVPTGTGGGQWVTTIPAELTPEKKIAQNANAIFVFALPR